jgi:hypothetical protein
MQLRPEIQIASMIKAMKDVVIPAIDPANKLAVEQSQLIIGLLSLLSIQLPLQYRFDRDELARLLDCAKGLQGVPAGDPAVKPALERLRNSGAAAAAVLEQCRVEPDSLTASVREMRAAIGALVKAVAGTKDLAAQLGIERIVLAMSKDQLIRDRSLVKMQGWEPHPAAVPDIATLLPPVSPPQDPKDSSKIPQPRSDWYATSTT